MLVTTEYYKHQFSLISNLSSRKNDTELIYTLKLCYEAGLDRSIQSVETLQRGIFDSSRSLEQLGQLSTWVYLSGQYYAMHDVCKDAVKFDEYALVKIMGYLDNNLNSLMPQLPVWTYQFGVFFGNNIAFVSSPTSAMPFSDEVYKGIRKKRNFAIGLATGIGEVFTSLDEKTQEVVLNLSQTEVEFSKGLGTALGNKFAFLDDAHKNLIFEKVGRNIILSRFLGYGIGCNFSKIEKNHA